MIKRLLYWGMIAFLAIFSNNKLNAQTPGENFDVTHYEISLWNFDFTAHTLQGRAKVRLTATEPTNTFVLELKSLTVTNIETSFLLSGSIFFVENSFNQENDLLIITTELTLETGASADFLIDYGGNTFNESWGGIMWSERNRLQTYMPYQP